MAKRYAPRRKISFTMLIIIGLIIGFAIKKVAIGLIIGIVLGLLSISLIAGKSEEE